MIAFLIPYAAKIVGERFAKPLLIIVGVVLLVSALGVAKCAYDDSVRDAHDAKITAEAERKAREAQSHADAKAETREQQFNAGDAEIRNEVRNDATADPVGPGVRAALDGVRRDQAKRDKATTR